MPTKPHTHPIAAPPIHRDTGGAGIGDRSSRRLPARLCSSRPRGFARGLPRIEMVSRALKLSVDRDRRRGRFLLTGSANLLLLPKLGESLAGRMAISELQPFTASEQERAPGSFLSTWLAGHIKPALAASPEPKAALPLAARVIAGGFPEPLTRSPARARAWHRDYVRALLETVGDLADGGTPARRATARARGEDRAVGTTLDARTQPASLHPVLAIAARRIAALKDDAGKPSAGRAGAS